MRPGTTLALHPAGELAPGRVQGAGSLHNSPGSEPIGGFAVRGNLFFLSLLAAPGPLMPHIGECVVVTGQMILADAAVDLVFSGRV